MRIKEVICTLERGKVFEIVYSAVQEYRANHSEIYKNDLSNISVQPWTGMIVLTLATPEMISALQIQFELLVGAIQNLYTDNMGSKYSAFEQFDDIFDDAESKLSTFTKQLIHLSHYILQSICDLKTYSLK